MTQVVIWLQREVLPLTYPIESRDSVIPGPDGIVVEACNGTIAFFPFGGFIRMEIGEKP